jgi:hypothetical protein
MPSSPETPDRTTTIQKFTGIITEVSPVALPPGASENQVNLTNEERGVAQSRKALRPVTFNE